MSPEAPGRDETDERPSGLGGLVLGVALAGIGLVALALWAAEKADAEAAGGRARRGADFSVHIDDLPIMPGLSEGDDGYVFPLREGARLAETRLEGEADVAVVRGFYAATLAQLGWRTTAAEPYVYHRGRETLMFMVQLRPPRRGRLQRLLEAVFVVTPEDRAAPLPQDNG